MVQSYNSTDTATLKNFHFILPEWSDSCMVVNLSIAIHAFAMHMLTSLLVNEMLLLWYITKSTNFRGKIFSVEMVPSCLKHTNSVLSVFR